MTMHPIQESGMTFGPYPYGHCFYIEKSQLYNTIEEGVKISEFLLLRTLNGKPPVIWVVEAKSSSPRPETQPNFDGFILEIRDKFINAFSLGFASCLKRHPKVDEELSRPFTELNLSKIDIKFVLVIKDHKEDWLTPIQDALKKALHATIKTWNFSPTSVAVMNENTARNCHLIN